MPPAHIKRLLATVMAPSREGESAEEQLLGKAEGEKGAGGAGEAASLARVLGEWETLV